MLAIKNKHEHDKRIKFQEEGHIYWIDNDTTDLTSCTTFIKTFAHKFDTDKIISFIVKSYNYDKNPDYEYYKIPIIDIKSLWEKKGKEASEAGTNLHSDIEAFYNNVPVENTSLEYKQFLDFHQEHKHLKIYRTEWCIFSDILRITGSIDAVFENTDGTLSIYDWKRSKGIKMYGYGNKHLKHPFTHLHDCNFYHYSLQLNLYRKILETYYGKTIKDMFLAVFHPDNYDCKYIKIKVSRMEKEIESLFSYRTRELVKLGYKLDYDENSDDDYVIESESEDECEEPIKLKRLLPSRKNI